MTRLRVAAEIFQRFPEALIGVAAFSGVDNAERAPRSRRRCEPRRRGSASGSPASSFPSTPTSPPGATPTGRSAPSPRTTLRRSRTWCAASSRGRRFRTSIRWSTSTTRSPCATSCRSAARTSTGVEGDVLLTFATGDEPPVHLLGEPEARAPKPGEVIYRDDLGTLCRRWNWKEAERTKLTAATRHAFLVIEGLPPVMRAEGSWRRSPTSPRWSGVTAGAPSEPRSWTPRIRRLF